MSKRTIKAWLRRNAMALASLVVAIAGLWVAWIVQSRDLAYKELSIKPELVLSHQTTTFSFKIKNAGLGPAVIQKIVFKFGGRCFDAFNLNFNESHFLTVLLTDHLYLRPARDIGIPLQVPISQHSGVHANVMTFRRGITLPHGADLDVFALSEEQRILLQSKLSEFSFDERNGVARAFSNAAINIPMGMHYCSMSGVFCHKVPLKGCLEEKR